MDPTHRELGMIGQTVSHYRITGKLGEGGMGVVYKALDTKLKRPVALKFLPPELTSDPEAKERFIREARAASALDHPNICIIHEINETEDGHIFIVMTCYDGETLRVAAESGPFVLAKALDIAIQVAEGLQEAHAKGIVHRDIKPANIMVLPKGRVIVMDFGLARLSEPSDLTEAESTVGTVSYMSPEQTRGKNVDHRTDIWALGVVLYELISGQRPFRGDYDQAVVYSILNEEPERISILRPETPEQVERIVNRMLSKDPTQRYGSVRDLLDDLKQVVEQVAVSDRRRRFKHGLRSVVTSALAAVPADAPSIAVLPFCDMSPDKDQEYFADGLSEELSAVLAKLRGLRVAARTSAFAFKGKRTDIREIGRELNVAALLEGSVRRVGDRVRISTQLIDSEDGCHLWSETYDRRLDDIFAIQDDIARSVAKALRVMLLGKDDDVRLPRGSNAEAFNLVLHGQYLLLRSYTREDLGRVTDYFRRAIELDPDYAVAWDELAVVYIRQSWMSHIPMDEGYQMARKAVERAIELDPRLAHAQSTLSQIQSMYDWDFAAAELSIQRALMLEPGNARVLSVAAELTRALGRPNEAITLASRAVQLDPLNPIVHSNLGVALALAGHLSLAESAFDRALELNPQNPNPHLGIGNIRLQQGRYKEALARYERHISDPGLRLLCRAVAYPALGRQTEGDAALKELIDKHSRASAYQIAEVCAIRGEADEAFAWLERAYKQHDLGLFDVKIDPNLANLHDDPRWAEFLMKMGL